MGFYLLFWTTKTKCRSITSEIIRFVHCFTLFEFAWCCLLGYVELPAFDHYRTTIVFVTATDVPFFPATYPTGGVVFVYSVLSVRLSSSCDQLLLYRFV